MKKRFCIQDIQYLFYALVLIRGQFFKDITGDLSIMERHQDATPHTGLWRKALWHGIEESPFHGNGYSNFQAGQLVIIQFLDPCEWEMLFSDISLSIA